MIDASYSEVMLKYSNYNNFKTNSPLVHVTDWSKLLTEYAVFESCEINKAPKGGAILIDTYSSAVIGHTTFNKIKSRNGACIAAYLNEE